ncbi:4'-phosphopantetheinyl transferase family protein [Streptomyces abyssomicinicus]|uniref:4'-phosphopantetheinyl transferase family protein n=1 Tax=Streptomyces abyssomicinicus TaxID=574929 RepID=UPI0012502BDB|nr:4'-phosphopantetheinyl transferase superfamily protein [Streptomyces abyssomicinicus]
MIEGLLPPGAVAAEAFDDDADGRLPAEEARVVAGAVAGRHREFTTGRLCARRALARAGLPPVAVPTGRAGEPCWPEGVIGSITHCAGYRAAAVARACDVTVLGIDAEPDLPLPDDTLEAITLPDERRRLRLLERAAPGRAHWGRLLFSAKESAYKAWFPLGRRLLDFSDAEADIRPDGSFEVTLRVPGPQVDGGRLTGFGGRWTAYGGLLLTAVGTVVTTPRQVLVGTPTN